MNKKYGLYLFLVSLILIIFGIIMIYSSSSIWAIYKFNDSFKYVKHQVLFFVIGLIIVYFLYKVDYRIFYKYSSYIFITFLILLILVLIPGIGSVRNGSRSWFGIGSFGIQPSEFMKLALIIVVCKYYSKYEKNLNSFKNGIFPILFILFFVFGLIMLQPDFGTGMIIVISVLAVMYVAGVNLKFFIVLGLLGVVGIVGLIIAAPYRMARITSFIDPWSDPLGSGFQIIQSLYAIGPGGLLGMGFLKSRQKQFYLPEPQTDFIFSIISEEFGALGVIIVVSLFSLLLFFGFKIAINSQDKFSKLLSFGLVFQILIQAVMNLFVVIGLIPVTGVTLPFLSYGGSSLLITMIEIGIVLNISKNNH